MVPLFKSRINRSTFYLGWLLYILVFVLFTFLDSSFNFDFYIALLIIIPLLILGTSLYVRRLHDLGLSGFWTLLIFVPIVNIVFNFYLYFRRGQDMTNKYGEKPSFNNNYLSNLLALNNKQTVALSSNEIPPNFSATATISSTPVATSFHPKIVLLILAESPTLLRVGVNACPERSNLSCEAEANLS